MNILFVIPPGLPDTVAHHEATSGMGALNAPAAAGSEPGFLYPPHTVAACAAATRAAGLPLAVLDGARRAAPAAFAAEVAARPADVLAVLVSQGTAHADDAFLRLLRQRRPRAGHAPIMLLGPSAHFVAGPWLAEGLADAALLGEPEGAFAEAAAGVAEGTLAGAFPAAQLRPDRYRTSPPLGEEGSGARSISPLLAGEGPGARSISPLLAGEGPGARSISPLLAGEGPGARSISPLLAGEGPGVRSLLVDLDVLPFPAWDLIPWQPYGAISLLSSRGCPAGCAYCAYTQAQGAQIRFQSPERTVAELVWLAQTIQPPRIQVRDPVFAHDRARVAAICEGIIARGIRVSFNCESRPEHFDDDLLRLLQAAGCRRLKIGLESGDLALLQQLGRTPDVAAAERYIAAALRVARTCAAIGLRCQVFVMAGLPGQDTASLARTEAVLRQLPAGTMITAKPYQAHPGTPLDAVTMPVPADTLARLEHANAPEPPLWRRVSRGIRQRIEMDKWMRHPGPGAEFAQPSPEPSIAPLTSVAARVFLTGGNGFLGGHVARALSAAGARVVALVRLGSDLGALADLPVEISWGDLARPAEWRAALAGCELCFHVAALYGGAEQAQAMYAVNVAATGALLAACAEAGVRRVIHTGTIGTVGRPADPRMLPDETTPFTLWDQASHYVRSKYLGEQVARGWSGAGLDVVIVKPTAPVGAGDARPSATGRRIQAALRGELTPYPPGGINHVPVIDVAAGHLLAARRGTAGQAYILGHRAGNLDQAAFLRLVAEAAGMAPLCPMGARQAAAGSLPGGLTANPARAIRELGLPQSDLAAAFVAAVRWFAQHDRSRAAKAG